MSLVSRPMAALTITAVLAAGCSSAPSPSATRTSSGPATSSAASAMAARGVEAGIGDIPWSQVGPGWLLATWSPVEAFRDGEPPAEDTPAPQDPETSLYLVDPEGGRYLITTFPPAPADGQAPYLMDWSGDGGRALFYSVNDTSGTVTEVDLHTGKRTTFAVDHGFATTPRYTKPDGKAVLLLENATEDSGDTLERVSLDGTHQLTYPADALGSRFTGEFLSTADGTHLVLGTDTGLTVVGNDGTVGKRLPIGGASWCQPTRWWDDDATIAIANCRTADESGSRLWLVPVDGRAPTALTATIDGTTGPVYGAGSAWNLPDGIFVQGYGACGVKLLTELDRVGAIPTEVKVPDVDPHSSVDVIGAHDGHLDLRASRACGAGQSLLDYDPATRTSTVLLGGDVNGGGVINALSYASPWTR